MPEEVQKFQEVQEEEFLQEELQRYLRTMLNIWHLYGARLIVRNFANLCTSSQTKYFFYVQSIILSAA